MQDIIRYAEETLVRRLMELDINPQAASETKRQFMMALLANAARMDACKEAPFVQAIPESRRLFDLLALHFVTDVKVTGLENVARALQFMANGGNVLLVSNHTSGADTLVLDYVVNKTFNNAAHDWIYMAGHVVNYYLVPMTMSGGIHRVQIFSAKYCQQATTEERQRMKQNNMRALMSIAPQIIEGGKCVVLYPEGGRGEGSLLAGEPRTMKIPQLMAEASPNGLMVLPSYVEATSILPVVRGSNEFNEFLEHIQPGKATLSLGPGVMWDDLQPNKNEIHRFLERNGDECLNDHRHALKCCLIKKCMRMIATMMPQTARGPHA